MGKTITKMAQNNARQTIVIYITDGVIHGRKWRNNLASKFLDAMCSERQYEVTIPRWADLPFPTEMCCGVSDDLNEERTCKLMRQGVLIVHSSWILMCIAERRLLVPIHEERFALRPIEVSEAKKEVVHIRSTTEERRAEWMSHHDAAIRYVHRLRTDGDNASAEGAAKMLMVFGKTQDDIERRERLLCGGLGNIFG
jgi:hypothetical protein